MATIQYSALVSGIQGKLNGSVLSKGRSGQVIYQKPTQRFAPSPAQLHIRRGLARAAKAWFQLTSQERLDWATISGFYPQTNKFGESFYLTGYQYYLKMWMLTWPSGSPFILEPYPDARSAYEYIAGGASATWSLTDNGYVLDEVEALFETISDSTETNFANLYISLPIQDFGRPYFKTWYLIGQQIFDANLGSSYSGSMVQSDITMSPGWYTFEGAKHYLKSQFFIPNWGAIGVEQIWDLEPSNNPVVMFPDLDLIIITSVGSLYRNSLANTGFRLAWYGNPVFDYTEFFTCELQWAAPQETTAPVDEGDWGDLIVQGLAFVPPPEVVVPAGQDSPTAFYTPYTSEFPAGLTVPAGWYVPLRIRLIDIATGIKSEWTYSFAPIVGVPD